MLTKRLVGASPTGAIAPRTRTAGGQQPRALRSSIDRIRDSVIGDDVVLDGPFGPRRLVYADYTASGRALSFVEDYIRDRVLPLYANTHTEASATGLQTTAMREDARGIIHARGQRGRRTTSSCSAARARRARSTSSSASSTSSARSSSSDRTSTTPTSCRGASRSADVVTIREDADGRVDLEHLEFELERHAASTR